MKKYLLFLAMITLMTQCKPGTNTSENTMVDANSVEAEAVELIVLEKNGITLTEMVSPDFENASLKLKTPAAGSHSEKSKVAFSFDVENYELGSQTADAAVKNCANSDQGQHIHLILNNAPYTAHYESDFESELQDGHYIGMAFLSRSYHESIKHPSAYQVFEFSVGKSDNLLQFDPAAPHMFYSRPKGAYTGADIQKVMLDFYLVNTELSEAGYKVKATINGTEFLLDKWVPYAMEGLPEGNLTIELALLDPSGAVVPSPFNPVSRTVTLTK